MEKGYINNLELTVFQLKKTVLCANFLKGRLELDMIMMSVTEGMEVAGMQGIFLRHTNRHSKKLSENETKHLN